MKLMKYTAAFLLFMVTVITAQKFDVTKMDEILYGVAYYYEYMPYERLEKDVAMMNECGINFVRICESTWGYHERQDGEFYFEHLDRILNVMHEHNIKVIIGTPTYAVPTWLVKKHPEILAERKNGNNYYGSRQNMDITHPVYRYYAERIIRKLVEYTVDHPAVIGFQVDNETKHYQTEGENVQKQFVQYLKKKFKTPEEMNRAYGFHYWSNSVNAWEDMPSTMGSINGSLNAEFKKFQRSLVTNFLAWQVSIINEYKKPHQFVTQNFDLSWRSGSYSIQKDVDHFEAAEVMDAAGIDVYHKTQNDLTGETIAFAGDLARSMKGQNYFVIETSAQSILNSTSQRLHYPGQLRLQAFSHLASGANMVAYWPWHSIHNSAETYWKGILSHDLEPNPTFEEVKIIASEFKRFKEQIINLEKTNEVAIYFSNEAISALDDFPFSNNKNYNDIVKEIFGILYNANIEADFADHTIKNLSKYKLLIVPPLYSASDSELEKLNEFVENGGHIIYMFKSGFTNENVQVRTDRMPALLRQTLGFSYQQFTNFESIRLKEVKYNLQDEEKHGYYWGELLIPENCKVLAYYDHQHWGKYAAITENNYGKGKTVYCGTYPSQSLLKQIILNEVENLNIEVPEYSFPIIMRKGVNGKGNNIMYIFNYSEKEKTIVNNIYNGLDLFNAKNIKLGDELSIKPWDFKILIEE